MRRWNPLVPLVLVSAMAVAACEKPPTEPTGQTDTFLAKPTCPGHPSCKPDDPPGDPGDAEILYVGIVKGKRAIMGMAADGSGRSPIWRCPASCWTPKWSPDGSRIAFVANHDGPANLYAVNADGSGLVRLTEHDGTDGEAEWSPDGNHLVFERNDAASYPFRPFSLFVVNSDGTGVAPVPGEWPPNRLQPDWSPDGTKIVFSGGGADWWEATGIFVANVDGTDVTQITPPVPLCDATVIPKWIDYEPQWSPDGTRIAVSRDYMCEPESTTNNHDIVVMNADGTGVVNVTNTPDWESSQDWSPDGSKFVYDGGDWSIHVINVDGSGHETLIPASKKWVEDPDWRP